MRGWLTVQTARLSQFSTKLAAHSLGCAQGFPPRLQDKSLTIVHQCEAAPEFGISGKCRENNYEPRWTRPGSIVHIMQGVLSIELGCRLPDVINQSRKQV